MAGTSNTCLIACSMMTLSCMKIIEQDRRKTTNMHPVAVSIKLGTSFVEDLLSESLTYAME